MTDNKTASDEELMEGIQMLMAQAGVMAKDLSKRGISHQIMIYEDGNTDVRFWRSQEITPGKVK